LVVVPAFEVVGVDDPVSPDPVMLVLFGPINGISPNVKQRLSGTDLGTTTGLQGMLAIPLRVFVGQFVTIGVYFVTTVVLVVNCSLHPQVPFGSVLTI